jgi:hypothetical protein
MSFELLPTDFDDSRDISELTDYLRINSAVPAVATISSMEWTKIYGARDMAVSWVQYNAQTEGVGRRFSTAQLIREARIFGEYPVDINETFTPGIINLATSVAEMAMATGCIIDEDTLMLSSVFQLKNQLLVDRLRVVGFELPILGESGVFSDHWKAKSNPPFFGS